MGGLGLSKENREEEGALRRRVYLALVAVWVSGGLVAARPRSEKDEEI